MAGKNAGRPRPSRRKQQNGQHQDSRSCHRQSILDVANQGTDQRFPPPIYDRLISHDLAFTQISNQSPSNMKLLRECRVNAYIVPILNADSSLYILGLVIIDKRLYPAEFCSRLDFMNYVWLQYVFYDEGCRLNSKDRSLY